MQPPLRSDSTFNLESTRPNTPCPLPTISTEYSISATVPTRVSTAKEGQTTPGPSALQTLVQQWSPISVADSQPKTTISVPAMPKLSYQTKVRIKRLTGREFEHYGTSLSSTPQKQVTEAVDTLVTNVSSKPERAKIMTRVLGTLQLQQEMADSTIPVIWDTVSSEQLWDSQGGEMAFKKMVSYQKHVKPVIAKVNLSEHRKLRYENQLNEHWGGDWKSAMDPQGSLLPKQLSEHLLQKLTHIPKFWTAGQVHQALRYQVKHRAKGGRRGVRTTLLLMPEDVSQVMGKLAVLSAGNNNDLVEITPEVFEASFPLKQRASTRFSRDSEPVQVVPVATPTTRPQQVAGSGRRSLTSKKIINEKGGEVDLQQDERSDSEEYLQDEDDIASDNRKLNADSDEDEGRQGEGSLQEDSYNNASNKNRGNHSSLQTLRSEPDAVEVEEVREGIITAPDASEDEFSESSTQLDQDGDEPMLDANPVVWTTASYPDEFISSRPLSVCIKEQTVALGNKLRSTTTGNRQPVIAPQPCAPLAPEYKKKWWDHLHQLGVGVGGLPLLHPTPGLPTYFPNALLLRWKRELDMHHSYAPTDPSDALLTTCIHSIAQQCLLQDPRLYLQAVNSRPERSYKLIGYPCCALYVAAGRSQQSVIRVSLSDSDDVRLEAIADTANQKSPDRWKEQMLAALVGVGSGLATEPIRSEPVGGRLAWHEVDTQSVMICPVQVPLRISQVVQQQTLRYIDLHYLTTENNELELKWLGTHDSVSWLHRNQYIPPCLPSGDSIPGTHGSSERTPFTVELRGVWAVGDPILGLRSWDSPIILEELRRLDDERFVEDVLSRINVRAMECYSKLDEWIKLQGWVEEVQAGAKRSRVGK